MATSSATTVWEGELEHGAGKTTPASAAFATVDVSWTSRTARAAGKTSPRSCSPRRTPRATACSLRTSSGGRAAARAPQGDRACQVRAREGRASSHIVVTGRVPGIDEQAFGAAADAAGDGCPISGALKGNVEITVEATLES